jgi:predicted MFS family arabinose efflux permease
VWAALLGLGAATGLVAGGAITEAFGWRWIFLVNLPIGLAVLVLAARTLRPTLPRGERVGLDLPGAVLVTAGLLLLVYTVVETHDRGWGSLGTLGGLGGAAALLAAFVLHERSARDPLVPPGLVRRRTVAVGNAVMLVAAAGLFAMFFFITLYMQVVKGWTPLRAGVSALAFSASLGVASGVATQLVTRVPVRLLISGGLLVGAGGMLLMTRLEPGSTYSGALLPALVVCGLGLGLAFVPLASVVTSGAQGGEAGVASGSSARASRSGPRSGSPCS